MKIIFLAVALVSFLTTCRAQEFYSIVVNGKWGYVNHSGRTVVAAVFSIAHSFSEGLAAVQINNRWGYIDQSGKLAVAPRFDQANAFKNSVAVVYSGVCFVTERTPKNAAPCRFGYIDPTGKYIWKPTK
jgi:hypothetical protein